MMKRMTLAWLTAFVLPLSVQAATIPVDPNLSTSGADKLEVKADGIDSARISINLKNTNFGSVEGAVVSLTSSRGPIDDISPEETTTSLSGRASFTVKSLKNGTSVLPLAITAPFLTSQSPLFLKTV
ncbi:MAG: Ig-like domain-containing protein [Candidatus Nomurabacteria bacterium]|nr:MAG: Ig-like domain-containing protein [Candidatus Nomurabacteria bacterium]